MSSTPLIDCAALPFLWAYEVSCRARTGSVLHKVTLDERLVIRPVFRIRETGGSPASLAFSGERLRQTLFVNERMLLPSSTRINLGIKHCEIWKCREGVRISEMRRTSPGRGEMFQDFAPVGRDVYGLPSSY